MQISLMGSLGRRTSPDSFKGINKHAQKCGAVYITPFFLGIKLLADAMWGALILVRKFLLWSGAPDTCGAWWALLTWTSLGEMVWGVNWGP